MTYETDGLIMLILTFTKKNAERIISESIKILENSGIIAYPTESFYALGALATDKNAVKKLFELKKRPAEKPLPLIVGDRRALEIKKRHRFYQDVEEVRVLTRLALLFSPF